MYKNHSIADYTKMCRIASETSINVDNFIKYESPVCAFFTVEVCVSGVYERSDRDPLEKFFRTDVAHLDPF